jgi:excisionase family DNA binding protein
MRVLRNSYPTSGCNCVSAKTETQARGGAGEEEGGGVMPARAFTVASLAREWECSEGVVRKLVASGALRCFRIGTLIRIPAEEVQRFECQNIASNDSAEDSPSCGETAEEGDIDRLLPRPIGSERKRKPANAGGSGTVLPGPWAA